ncbi:OstA family protein [Marinithermus hydrothermalis DSM 14884]|uniref:OstA family protein n=2 Tax=Marinithermus TaxID=186191 RepID=F2NLJ5_MARHT|nr:OstA family protein [Marinithermus hydrothermalis DSM 14884]
MRSRVMLFLMTGLLAAGLAASGGRILTIKYDGTRSGNLRFGPWTYESSRPDGVHGQVGDLEIFAPRAVLEAPEGKSMQEAEGERTATFEGEVVVKRGRVTARGPRLVYSEATGVGVLEGPAEMRQEPAREGEDPVEVQADKMTFDVDADVSTSEGSVRLTSGNQEGTADLVYYEEERGLAVFSMREGTVTLVRRRSGEQGDLVIQAREVRSLTREKQLIATGGVTLVDGEITTTGDALYYDDNEGTAIIIGSPAVSKNAAEGLTLSAGTLLHDVKKHRVQAYRKPFELPEATFAKQGE